MPLTLPESEFDKMKAIVLQLDQDFEGMRSYFRQLAEYMLPLRYNWLHDTTALTSAPHASRRNRSLRNEKILDSTATRKARDLAAGMLNGVTSPARPWFSLRPVGFPFPDRVPVELQRYLDEVQRRLLLVLAESNFYNSMALLLLDMVVFGTAGMLAYEDFEDVVRFYNLPMGGFKIGQSKRRIVDLMSRSEVYTVRNLVAEFGLENCTEEVQRKFATGKRELFHGVTVHHIIEPNLEDERFIPGGYAYREFYWEAFNNEDRRILRRSVFTERPGTFPRWETLGEEVYGLSPAMDALGDVMQLQQETLRKAQILDKIADPPTVWDAALRNRPTSTLPGARNYTPGNSTFGGKPVYQLNPPLAEITADINNIKQSISDTFFNDLFRMISNLDTVRSATEIDARREEKLIMMGAVLERLENEALDPIMLRVFGIMKRKGLLPELPSGFEEIDIEVQYVSVLSDAQRSVGTGSIERAFQVIGNLGSLAPEVLKIPNWSELTRDYFDRLNLPAAGINSKEELAAQEQRDREMQEAQQAALVGEQLTSAAKNLSQTEVGGGRNAMQELLG